MPNDNQNTNTQTNQPDPTTTGNTPPVVPDFMAAASTSSSLSQSQTPTQTPFSAGIPLAVEDAQSPPSSFDITPSEPKKKFGGKKIIATILGVLILAGGILGGVVLTRQNQDIREDAAACGYCNSSNICVSCTGGKQSVGECTTNSQCAPGSDQNPIVCTPGKEDEATCSTDGCAGTKTRTCNSQGTGWSSFSSCEKLNPNCPVPGGAACSGKINNGNLAYSDTNSNSITIDASWVSMCQQVCSDASLYASKCTCTQTGLTGGCNTNCTIESNLSAGQVVSLTNPTCGTVQIDVGCKNSANTYGSIAFVSKTAATACGGTSTPKPPVSTPKPTPVPTPTPTQTPSPAPGTAMCVDVKAYTETWTLLTASQLSGLKANNKVNFCVRGSTTQGTFTKAKFTINGAAQAETVTKRPSSDDFCQLYTIPAGTTSFSITAQIFHSTLGWK